MADKRMLLCCVVFPANLPYFDACVKSVERQDTDAFDFLLLLDGITAEQLPPLPPQTVVKTAFGGSPLANRIDNVVYARSHGYEAITWIDSDDEMEPGRMSFFQAHLSGWDMVVHDFSIMDQAGRFVENAGFADRVRNPLTAEQLLYQNVVGLGNTLFSVETLSRYLEIPTALTAVDWWLACRILLDGGRALVYGARLVRYRQYGANIASVRVKDFATLEKQARILKEHYEQLLALGTPYDGELTAHLRRLDTFLCRAADADFVKTCQAEIEKDRHTAGYTWWEHTNKIILRVV